MDGYERLGQAFSGTSALGAITFRLEVDVEDMRGIFFTTLRRALRGHRDYETLPWGRMSAMLQEMNHD